MIKEKDGVDQLDNRKNKDWYKNLDKFKLEKTIGWQISYCKKNR